MSTADELSKLSELREKGHLSQDEFKAAKRRILDPKQPSNPSMPRQAPQKPMNKAVWLVALGIIGILIIASGGGGGGPKWGEPGYRPRISDKCRSVWASINVDADRYVAVVCTPEEQHEIAGYRAKK
jgi:hypothetical protein